jgi:hypothetical protein
MSKATIARLFIVATVGLAVGFVVTLATVVAALLYGAITFGGPTVVTVDTDVIAGALGWLVVAALVAAAGAIAALATWVGALLNTARREDKTWFVALLVLGLCSFGWLAMIAYIVAGPDSTTDGTSVPRAVTA